ncbi:hypothetical protein QL285_057194 [Trifolium repens]|nr:hypothetical protein QL285_057194 [Trifolium repens]
MAIQLCQSLLTDAEEVSATAEALETASRCERSAPRPLSRRAFFCKIRSTSLRSLPESLAIRFRLNTEWGKRPPTFLFLDPSCSSCRLSPPGRPCCCAPFFNEPPTHASPCDLPCNHALLHGPEKEGSLAPGGHDRAR